MAAACAARELHPPATAPCLPQVFALYGELIAARDSDGSTASAAWGDGMMAFLRKQLHSSQARHRRVGIIGTVQLAQRLGEAVSSGDERGSDVGECLGSVGERAPCPQR